MSLQKSYISQSAGNPIITNYFDKEVLLFFVLSPKAHFKKKISTREKKKIHRVDHSKEGHRKNCSRDLIEQINRLAKSTINLLCCDVLGPFSLSGISQKRSKVSKIAIPFNIPFFLLFQYIWQLP